MIDRKAFRFFHEHGVVEAELASDALHTIKQAEKRIHERYDHAIERMVS